MVAQVTKERPPRRPPGYWKREVDRLTLEVLELKTENHQLRGQLERASRKLRGERGGPPQRLAEIFNLTPPEG